eukprot:433283_1
MDVCIIGLKAFSLQSTQTLTRFNGFLSPTLLPNYSPTIIQLISLHFYHYFPSISASLPPTNYQLMHQQISPLTKQPTITETEIETDENDSNNSEIYLERIVKHQLYC